MTTANAVSLGAPIATIYQVNETLFTKTLNGLTEDELWRRPTEQNNPMLWVAGHVADTRALVLRVMGETCAAPWPELFGRGCALKNPADYPTLDEIQTNMNDVSLRLNASLQSATDEQLSSPSTGPQFPNAKTLADQIAFLALHDSYHIGQMAYIRKALGHEGPVG